MDLLHIVALLLFVLFFYIIGKKQTKQLERLSKEAMQSILIHAYFKGIDDAVWYYQEKEDVEALRNTFRALLGELKQSK